MLPIHAVLPDLLALLGRQSNAVLIAPPGAGKTTVVAPALLGESWCTGRILLLSPRRLAARAAAERMAELAGEPVGGRIGYATRLDSKQSAATRIMVLTEGIFRNLIQHDPELGGVSAVLFDEVHERSLDSDFGLALALDAQAALRPDLRLIAMSATLDGARFGEIMKAETVESEGRSHPLTLRHIGRRAEARIEDEVAAAILRALDEEAGGCLVFLPGVAEIERTADRLGRLPEDVMLHRLHGSLDPTAQRAAIAAEPEGKRKLILATSIAETSLTLDGVRIVVDSGLARRPRYDRAAGMTRLVTERASQAAVTQRAGRAARQGPGTVYRLWEEAATAGLPRFDPPEIIEADLSALALDCAIWGVSDPRQLRWIDPPPDAAISEARARLISLGALDGDGRPTAHGRQMAGLPVPPRLAHMLIAGAGHGIGAAASEVAVLLSERGLGGTDVDLELRRDRWRRDRGKRADAARGLAKRFAAMLPASKASAATGDAIATAIALAFPDRLARRRGAGSEHWASVGGRGFRLDPATPLAKSDWLAVAEIQGIAAGARIVSAAAITWRDIEALYADRIETRRTLIFDPASGAVEARRERRLGAVTLASGYDSDAHPDAVAYALIEGVRRHGLARLDWGKAVPMLRTRAAYAGHPLDDARLLDSLDQWLAPLLAGKRALAEIDPQKLYQGLESLLDWDARRAVDQLAPAAFHSPAGSVHPIDYGAEGGPQVTLRVQALFGLDAHPTIGRNKVPLVFSLTSPAGHPIQTTRDLPGFWAGSWADVAKQMRGEYPKHNWPDNPAAAIASLKTKKAQSRS